MQEPTLIQVIQMMKEVSNRDYNNEYEVFFSKGRPIVETKLMEVKIWN